KELEEIELADIVVVPSKFVYDTYVSNGVLASKIRINHFGTDLDYFKPKKWDHTPEKIKFLFFGSLNGRKGLPLLFEAWEQISANTDAELILAGYEKIPAHINIPQNVTILGSVLKENRLSLFHSADVFVFPSFYEGFAQVQIEAAACGLPLIGTYHSGGEEIIQQNRNGILVDVEDVDGLTNALLFFIENKTKIPEMGHESFLISKDFSWKEYGKRWEKIISEIA
ncbi:MAG: glycosyltransferase family 4 protein, partial [Chitinophagaceae bacterium]